MTTLIYIDISYNSSLNDDFISYGNLTFQRITSISYRYTREEIDMSNAIIPYQTFKNTTNILSVFTNFTSVENEAFQNCSNLQTITFYNSLNNIGDYAFNGCTSLSVISVMGEIKKIGMYAFKDCINLQRIEIPDSVLYSNFKVTQENAIDANLVHINRNETITGDKNFIGKLQIFDADVMDISSNQTITGIKNFNYGKLKVDNSDVMDISSTQNISGVKNYTKGKLLVGGYNVVDVNSAQNISGVKNYTSGGLTIDESNVMDVSSSQIVTGLKNYNTGKLQVNGYDVVDVSSSQVINGEKNFTNLKINGAPVLITANNVVTVEADQYNLGAEQTISLLKTFSKTPRITEYIPVNDPDKNKIPNLLYIDQCINTLQNEISTDISSNFYNYVNKAVSGEISCEKITQDKNAYIRQYTDINGSNNSSIYNMFLKTKMLNHIDLSGHDLLNGGTLMGSSTRVYTKSLSYITQSFDIYTVDLDDFNIKTTKKTIETRLPNQYNYLTFVDKINTDENFVLYKNTNLKYDISYNFLYAPTFIGDLSGNISVSTKNTTAGTRYITFVDGSGITEINIDTDLKYNASTNTLTCGLVDSSSRRVYTKSLGYITQSIFNYDTFTTETRLPNQYNYLTFVDTINPADNFTLYKNSSLKYDISYNLLYTPTIVGDISGNISVSTKNTAAGTRYLTFVDGSGITEINIDTDLKYNASTNTLTCGLVDSSSRRVYTKSLGYITQPFFNYDNFITESRLPNKYNYLTFVDTIDTTDNFALYKNSSLKYDLEEQLLYITKVVGDLSGTAQKIYIDSINSDNSFNILFGGFSSGSIGSYQTYRDTKFSYNPSSDTLCTPNLISTGTIIGDLSGVAQKIYIEGAMNEDNSFNVLFGGSASGNLGGYQTYRDTKFSYNPSSDTLCTPNLIATGTIIGDLSGIAQKVYIDSAYDANQNFNILIGGSASGILGGYQVCRDVKLYYNASTDTLFTTNLTASGTIIGDLSGNASQIYINSTNTSGIRYLTFASGTGGRAVNIDTDLTYNASTNILTVPTVVGDLSGNISVSTKNTNAGTRYLTFVDGSGITEINIDTDLKYNASTNTLTVSQITGNLTGDVSGVAQKIYIEGAMNEDNSFNVLFGGFSSGNLGGYQTYRDTKFSYNPSSDTLCTTNLITTGNIIGDLSGISQKVYIDSVYDTSQNYNILIGGSANGNLGGYQVCRDVKLYYHSFTDTLFTTNLTASGLIVGDISGSINQIFINSTNTSGTRYLTFVDGTGNKLVNIDTNLTYNASTNILTVPTVVGDLSGNISVYTKNTNAGTRYLTFVDGSGITEINIDTDLKYNASTNTLTVPETIGHLTGDVSGVAQKIYIEGAMNEDNSFNVLFGGFSSGNLGGYQTYRDTKFSYNPSSDTLCTTNLITTGNIIGDLSGIAQKVYIDSAYDANQNFNILIGGSASGILGGYQVCRDVKLYYNASTDTLFTTNLTASGLIVGDISGSINQIFINSTNTSGTRYLTFVDGTGNKLVNIDTNLTYNASTNILTVPTVVGDLSGNISVSTKNTNAGTRYLTFVDGSGITEITIDTDLKYNASTNTLTVPETIGHLTGDVSGVAQKIYIEGAMNEDNSFNVLFGGFSSGVLGGYQTYRDTKFSYNPSSDTLCTTNLIATGTITGNINGATNQIVTTTINTTGTRYLTFVDGAGNKLVNIDTDLTYNASTNILTVPTIVGDLSGNISVSAKNTTAGTRYLTFVDGSGITEINIDTDLKYNASTNTLTVTDIIGDLSGVASQIFTATTNTAGTRYLTFVDGSGDEAVFIDTSLKYDALNNVLTVPNIIGDLSGAASQIFTASTNTTGTRYLTFVDGSGNKSVNIDTSLKYDASNNILTVPDIIGDLSGVASQIFTASTNTAGTRYLTFVDGTGDKAVFIDTDLKYDASNNILTIPRVVGDLSGNISVSAINTTGTRYLTFVDGSGNKGINIDTDLKYDALNNVLTVPDIIGDLSGVASQIFTASTNTAGTRYLTFVDGTGDEAVFIDNDLKYDALNNILTVPRVVGDLSGNISVSAINTTGTRYLTFVDGSGNKEINIDSDLKYDALNNILTVSRVVGDLSGNIPVSATNITGTQYLTFVDGSGNKGINIDSDLKYDASLNILTVPRVVGDLSGNISVSTTNTNITQYLTFVDGSGNKGISIDSDLKYDAFLNILTVPRVVGDLSGNISVSATNITGTQYLTFVDGSGNKGINIDSDLKYDASLNILTVSRVVGDLSGNASQIFTNYTNISGTRYLTFVDGSGNKSVNIDTNLNFDASTNILTVPRVVGDLSGNISVGVTDPSSIYYMLYIPLVDGSGNQKLMMNKYLQFDISNNVLISPNLSGSGSGGSGGSGLSMYNFNLYAHNITSYIDDLPINITSVGTGGVNLYGLAVNIYAPVLDLQSNIIKQSGNPITTNNLKTTTITDLTVGNLTCNGNFNFNSDIIIAANRSITQLNDSVSVINQFKKIKMIGDIDLNGYNLIGAPTQLFTNYTNTTGTKYLTFVDNSGNKSVNIDTDLKYDASNNILTVPIVVGDLSGNASQIFTNYTDISGTRYLTFVDGSGNKSVNIDTDLKYDASTNILTVPKVVGDLSGNVTGSLIGNVIGDLSGNASQIFTNYTDISGTRYLTFVDNSGNKSVNIDTNLKYDASNNILTVPIIVGDLSGNASQIFTNYTDISGIKYLTFVDNSGNKLVNIDTNLKYDASNNILTVPTVVGDLSGNASQIFTNYTDISGIKYLTFVDNSGNKSVNIDTNLKYDASNNILTVPTVVGDLSGNASQIFTNYTDISGTRYLTFVDNSGNKSVNIDTNLKYDASNNILTVPTVVGDLSGNASQIFTNYTDISGTKYLTFVDNSGNKSVNIDTNLKYDASNNILTVPIVVGDLSGNASQIFTNYTDISGTRYLTFVNGSGNKSVNIDTNLKYDASTNILTVPTVVGDLSGNVRGSLIGNVIGDLNGNASQIFTNYTNTTGTRYLTFVDNSGNKSVNIDTNLKYDASNNILTVPTVVGDLSGNASNVSIYANDPNDNSMYYPPIVKNTGNKTNQQIFTDSSFYYDMYNKILYVPNITATVAASSIQNSATISVYNDNTNQKYSLLMGIYNVTTNATVYKNNIYITTKSIAGSGYSLSMLVELPASTYFTNFNMSGWINLRQNNIDNVNTVNTTYLSGTTMKGTLDLSYNNIRNVNQLTTTDLSATNFNIQNFNITNLTTTNLTTTNLYATKILGTLDFSNNDMINVNNLSVNNFSTNNFTVSGSFNFDNVTTNKLITTTLSGTKIIGTLDLSNNNITNINTLTTENLNATNLSGTKMAGTLDLSNNNITNIQSLSGTKMAGTLDLSNNNITNIQSLSGTKMAGTLDLSNNNITNIQSLSGTKIAGTLDLSNNNITNIQSLSGTKMAGTLDLSNNNITNINTLTTTNLNTTNLSTTKMMGTLDLSYNNIRNVNQLTTIDLSATNFNIQNFNITNLSGTKMIGTLDMSGNNITNINTLTTTNLSATKMAGTLDLNNNNITNINTISMNTLNINNTLTTTNLSATKMAGTLDLNNNNITNINTISMNTLNINNTLTTTNLSGTQMAGTLDLSNNNITNIKTLSGLGTNSISVASSLFFTGTSRSIGGLNDLSVTAISATRLQSSLSANNNSITNISTLGTSSLNATTITTTNLSGTKMTGTLDLSNNNITNINTLTTTNLNATTINTTKMGGTLDLNNNNITNIQSLSGTKMTGTLDLNNNNITNINTLTTEKLNGTIMMGTLDLNNNNITNINTLTTTNLNTTNLSGTKMTGTLDLSNNNITNINTLTTTNLNTTNLNTTNLNTTNLNTTNLSGTKMAGTLDLSYNNIDNVNQIKANNISLNSIQQLTDTSNNLYRTNFLGDVNLNLCDIKNVKNLNTQSFTIDSPIDNSGITITGKLLNMKNNTILNATLQNIKMAGVLDMSGNNIINLGSLAINSLGSISMTGTLDMSGNNIANIKSLSGAKMAGTLDLSSNNITNVNTLTTTNLSSTKMAGTLDLSSNDITNIKSLSGTKMTGTLDLSNNNITNVNNLDVSGGIITYQYPSNFSSSNKWNQIGYSEYCDVTTGTTIVGSISSTFYNNITNGNSVRILSHISNLSRGVYNICYSIKIKNSTTSREKIKQICWGISTTNDVTGYTDGRTGLLKHTYNHIEQNDINPFVYNLAANEYIYISQSTTIVNNINNNTSFYIFAGIIDSTALGFNLSAQGITVTRIC